MSEMKRTQAKGPKDRFERLIWLILSAVGSVFIVMFCVIALIRLAYPFELEWMEGAIVDHVQRVLSGAPLYVKPTLDFIPFIYTPLYYYVSAATSAIFGDGFLPLRLVSIFSTAGLFVLIFSIVKRETGRATFALTAVGLFAACYKVCGSWYDIGRVDMLAVTILLSAVWLLRASTKGWHLFFAGALFGLAFLAKQSTLLPTLTLALYAGYVWRWQAIWLVIPVVVVIGGTTLGFDATQDGWYSYYIYSLPNRHTLDSSLLIEFWTHDIFRQIPVMFAAFVALLWLLRDSSRRRDLVFWSALAIGSLASSWSMRVFAGGFENSLIPTAAALSIGSGIALGEMTTIIENRWKKRATGISMAVALVLGVQFLLLRYDPKAQLPTASDENWGKQFVSKIADVQGEVLLPYHGYLPVLAGKKSCAHKMAMVEIRTGDSTLYAELERNIIADIRSHRYEVIILNADWFSDEVTANYRNLGDPFPDRSMFYPVTGLATRPHYWFVPK